MQHEELTRQDLVRIVLYAIAVTSASQQETSLAFGHVRNAFMPFVKIGRDPSKRPLLPFTDKEWELLEDHDGLWRELKRSVQMLDEGSLRITITRESLTPFLHDRSLTSSTAKTLCYGQALKAFGLI